MFRFGKYIFAIAVSLIAAQAGAQQVLSLDSCVAMALRNNEKIKAAAKQTQQYRHTEKSYKANFFPNITGSVTDMQNFEGKRSIDIPLTDLVPKELQDALGAVLPMIGPMVPPEIMAALANTPIPSLGIEYKIGNVFNAGVQLEQPIYMGGKISAAYRMSKLGTKMAQTNEVLTSEQVVVSTHEAYALLLEALQMHEVAVQYDSLLSQLKADVANAERHGMCSHNDVLKVEVKKAEAELQVQQALNGIRLAQMNLCYNIGIPLTEQPHVEPLTVVVSPASNNASVETRPDYQLLEMKSQLAAEQIKLTRSDFLPRVGMMFNYGYLRGINIVGQKLFNNPSASLMVNLTIPIFHAGEGYHKIKAAKMEYERTLSEQKDLVSQMNLELQQAANALNESILEQELTQRNIDSAEENLKARMKSYEVGLETLTELLEAQTLWRQACAKQVVVKAQCIVNMAKYRKASGTL